MADYYNILRNAIEEMGASTPAARDAVFTRARSALQAQIAAIDPPLSEEAVKAQWSAIDQAIARLSGELAVADSLAMPGGGAAKPKAAEKNDDSAKASPLTQEAGEGAPPAAPEPVDEAASPEEPADAATQEPAPDEAAAAEPDKPAASEAEPAKDAAAGPDRDDGEAAADADTTSASAEAAEVAGKDDSEKASAVAASSSSKEDGEDEGGDAKEPVAQPGEPEAAVPPPIVPPQSPESATPEPQQPVSAGPEVETPKTQEGDEPEPGRIEPVVSDEAETAESEPGSELKADTKPGADRIEPVAGSESSEDDVRPILPGDRVSDGEKRRGRGGLIAAVIVLLLIVGGAAAAAVFWPQMRQLVAQSTGYELPPLPASLAALIPGQDGDSGNEPQQMARQPAAETPMASQPEPAAASEEMQASPADSDTASSQSGGEPPALPAGQGEPEVAAQPQTNDVQMAEETTVQQTNENEDAGPPTTVVTQSQEQTPAAESPAETAESPRAAATAQKDQDRPAPVEEPATEPALFAVEATPGGDGNQEDTQHRGRALWSASGSGKDAVLSVVIDIPVHSSRFTVEMRRNSDDSLPASHTLEFIHTPGEDDPDGRMMNVPGVLLRLQEDVQGQPLQGAGALIVPGQFLMGLKDTPDARRININLLKEGKWIVVPVLMESKKRALLVVRKGDTGEQALNTVLEAWGDDDLPEPSGVTSVPPGAGAPSITGLPPGVTAPAQ